MLENDLRVVEFDNQKVVALLKVAIEPNEMLKREFGI